MELCNYQLPLGLDLAFVENVCFHVRFALGFSMFDSANQQTDKYEFLQVEITRYYPEQVPV